MSLGPWLLQPGSTCGALPPRPTRLASSHLHVGRVAPGNVPGSLNPLCKHYGFGEHPSPDPAGSSASPRQLNPRCPDALADAGGFSWSKAAAAGASRPGLTGKVAPRRHFASLPTCHPRGPAVLAAARLLEQPRARVCAGPAVLPGLNPPGSVGWAAAPRQAAVAAGPSARGQQSRPALPAWGRGTAAAGARAAPAAPASALKQPPACAGSAAAAPAPRTAETPGNAGG